MSVNFDAAKPLNPASSSTAPTPKIKQPETAFFQRVLHLRQEGEASIDFLARNYCNQKLNCEGAKIPETDSRFRTCMIEELDFFRAMYDAPF